jgi:hypothetical protein
MARGPENLEAGLAAIQASAQQNSVVERRAAATRGFQFAVLALALVWAIWLRAVSSRPAPGSALDAVRSLERFARWGRRLGRPIRAGDTAREYALGVAQTAEQIGARANDAEVGRVVRTEGVALAGEVERSLYAPDGGPSAGGPAPRLWTALRRAWLAGKLAALPRRAPR